jgi:hypothetical protein
LNSAKPFITLSLLVDLGHVVVEISGSNPVHMCHEVIPFGLATSASVGF